MTETYDNPHHGTVPPKPDLGDYEAIDFTHVPSLRNRRGGWSPDKQRILIAALSRGLSVTRAAKLAGMSRVSAYRLRERPGAKSFCKAWDIAIDMAKDDAMEIVQEQSVRGEIRPVYYRGRVVSWRREFNERLTIKALKLLLGDRKLHSHATETHENGDSCYLSDFIEGRIPIPDYEEEDGDSDDW